MSKQVEVIRIVRYVGDEEAVRQALTMSLPLGDKVCTKYTITVAEHKNDLAKQVELSCGQVRKALAKPVVSDCCCPPKGHKDLWAAGPCPVHKGLRNLKVQ